MLETGMPDYEFRIFRDGAMAEVRVTSVENDDGACAQARKYLSHESEFDWIEVRRGLRFARKILPE
jgi:hypothetical protein